MHLEDRNHGAPGCCYYGQARQILADNVPDAILDPATPRWFGIDILKGLQEHTLLYVLIMITGVVTTGWPSGMTMGLVPMTSSANPWIVRLETT